LVGSPIRADETWERTSVYVKIFEGKFSPGTSKAIPGITNPEWETVHIPAIIKELDNRGVSNPILRAFIVATAVYKTGQGRMMKEMF
jgi:hypothetical protein